AQAGVGDGEVLDAPRSAEHQVRQRAGDERRLALDERDVDGVAAPFLQVLGSRRTAVSAADDEHTALRRTAARRTRARAAGQRLLRSHAAERDHRPAALGETPPSRLDAAELLVLVHDVARHFEPPCWRAKYSARSAICCSV